MKKLLNSHPTHIICNALMRVRALEIVGSCCIKCGDDNISHLEFDHRFNNGKQHRRMNSYGGSGTTFCYWIVRNPELAKEQLQTLCANCHKEKDSTFLKIEGAYQYWH